MRYDCEVYNNKEMECDGSDLGLLHGLYDGSEKKSGLGLDAGCVDKIPRVDKMDGEEKSTVSKRRVTEIEVRFDSDDDEPIGSMFKVKSKRNPKKVKVGFNGGKINDKQVELREERLLVKDEDLGGMNDTLASFKKKLKGPKKDTGSGLIAGRDLDINVAEPSGQSLNGPVKNEDLVSASISKEVEKDQITGDDESDGAADKKFANKAKEKSKRSRSAVLQKKTQRNTEFDDAGNGQKYGDQSLPSEKECTTGSGGGSNDCLGENLEDSLSAFIRKAQSGSIRKSRSSSRSKQINCDGLLEDPLPDVMISQPPSNYVTAVTGFDNTFHLESGRGSTDLTCDQNNNGKTQNADCTFSQVSNCIGPNELSSDPCLGISSGPLITNDILRSSDNIHGQSSRGTFEDSFAISSAQQSQSYLMLCSNNISMLQDGEVNEQTCGIQEGIKLESHDSDHFLDGNQKESLCAKVKGNYCFPSQEPTFGINSSVDEVNNSSIRKACDLGDDIVEMHNSISALEQMQKINLSDADMPTGGFSHSLDQQSKCVAGSQTSSTDQKFCSTFDKDVQGPCLGNDLSNSLCEDIFHETIKQVSGELLEPTASLSQNSLTCNEKMTVTSKPMDGIGSLQCLKGFRQAQPQASTSAFDSSRQVVICKDCISPNRVTGISVEEPDFASVSSQKEEASASDSRLSTVSPSGDHKQENSFQVNQLENSLETGDDPGSLPQQVPLSKSSTSFPRRSSSFHQNQASDDVCKGVHIPTHDLSGDEVANGSSSPSSMPDCNGNYADDIGSVPYPESKDNKLSVGQRAVRITRKRRQMDMAYEGDADWNILIHEQNFLVSNQAEDDNQLKRREKLDSHLTMFSEAENGGGAAVSAGLKARAVGPVEKIKFKEVLKRKGGLQEYLECRNHILGLWNKDVSRILPLSDCGVSDKHMVDESPCASLVRDIYAFLDYSGYINIGVASGKEITESGSKQNLQLLKEKNFGEKSGSQLADSDDGVSFILGRDKNFDKSMEEKNVATCDDENRAARDKRDETLLDPQALKLSTPVEPEECDDFQGNGRIEERTSNRIANVDLSSSISLSVVADGGTAHVIPSEHTNNSCGMLSGAVDDNEVHQHMQSDSEVRKRIIVIGAGPAGLAAARHLQRHGFHVTVLEARGRIGGRVFTDRTSLSVPVDLGASIITGVEADVATERRPDPSSLVCAQLGLELTVLNSDCPLYDTVTGHKVPADLDEALEAEYNSLLDDMVLLVAQKGEHAMRMSLEDGLEYALQRRRMVRSSKNYVESDLHKSAAIVDDQVLGNNNSRAEILSPLERRVMDWHFAHLEYGCAALLKEVSLPYWNQDDVYGGFGGAHCMIKGGYSTVVESLGEGLCIHLNHVVTNVTYHTNDTVKNNDQHKKVKVSTLNGKDFFGDAVLVTVPLGCLKKESIKFSPSLPQWKHLSIQRLGFGVLNKVVLEFSEVFWDDSVDYFGATAEETNKRGHCFMFWNVRKTVGAPVLIALVVGKAALYGQNMSSADHVNHALVVLRKLFGAAEVPDPVASVVTDWGRDPYSYGAYSYVAIGASGEDYDILGRPVENCLFFAGEATCKEHPDTVGGAMMSGLREAVRIMNILSTGSDCTAEVNAMEAAQRHTDSERSEVRDIMKRLDAVELSNTLYKKSLDGAHIMTREALLKDMFFKAKTTAARFHLVKELLSLPVGVLKAFAGTKKGLSTLNSWILDSMGKDGTQLLRHCVRLLVLVSTDLLAVRLSGIGKTVKEKVCVHTSRDIRAVASQLVNVWIEVFRKEKASNGGLKLLRPSITLDSSKSKYNLASGKPPLRTHHGAPDNRGTGTHLPPNSNSKKGNIKLVKSETRTDAKSEVKPSRSQGSVGRQDSKVEEDKDYALSKEEQAALAAEEEARAAAIAAAKAYASSDPRCNTSLQLPKIPSFHKFARREQYPQMDESDIRRRWSGGVLGRQDCISEIDSRNCKVRDWAVDFSAAACVNLDSSKMSVDNLSQRSHSNEIACQLNFREHSGESVAVDSSIFTKAWVDSAGSEGIKDYSAIERWQSQAAAADSDFFNRTMHIMDEEDSNINLKPPMRKYDGLANESSASQVTINREMVENQPRGAEKIKQAVVDYVASLLMPLYKARKIDKDGYKSIMKKTATKVMEQTTDVEKLMTVFEFLDFKRKNKIRAFVDKLIERHMAIKQGAKS